jgi:hypothetical protein
MLFEVNWVQFAQTLMPSWWRKVRFVAFMRVMVGQVRVLHGAFLSFRSTTLYNMTHTAQTMSLEHIINDRFDPLLRRIYIDNQPDPTQAYIFRLVEAEDGPALYRRWRIVTAYTTGQRVAHNGVIYTALANNTGVAPVDGSPSWSVTEPSYTITTLYDALNAADFKVMIPDVMYVDPAAMRSLVDGYKLAGKRYTIESYE